MLFESNRLRYSGSVQDVAALRDSTVSFEYKAALDLIKTKCCEPKAISDCSVEEYQQRQEIKKEV